MLWKNYPLEKHQNMYLEVHIFPFASDCDMVQHSSNLYLQFWYFLHDGFFALICISKNITLRCNYFDYWVEPPHLNFALRKIPHLPHSSSGSHCIYKSPGVKKCALKYR